MKKNIVFIQGGGEDGYAADKALAASLQTALGSTYDVHYPELRSNEAAPDFGWPQQIGDLLAAFKTSVLLVGHSLGASMILKYLTEHAAPKNITAVFLLATPFWEGTEEWKKGLKLPVNFAAVLPTDLPVFFYQCTDDAEVPFEQFNAYKQRLAQATFRVLENGGHQFSKGLTAVAQDMRSF